MRKSRLVSRLSLVLLTIMTLASGPLSILTVRAGGPPGDAQMVLGCVGLTPATEDCVGESLQPFESIIYDSDDDGLYDTGELVIVGTLTIVAPLLDEPRVRYLDTDDNTAWSSGEPVFYDQDGDTATAGDWVFLIGPITSLVEFVRDDPLIKFVDTNRNGQLNGVIRVTARIEKLGGILPDGTQEDVDAIQIIYRFDPNILKMMRQSYPGGSFYPEGMTYTAAVRTHCIGSKGSPLDAIVIDETARKVLSSHLCTPGGPPREPDSGLGCDPASSIGTCPGADLDVNTVDGLLQDFDMMNLQFMILADGAFTIEHVLNTPGTPGTLIKDLDGFSEIELVFTMVNAVFDNRKGRVAGDTVLELNCVGLVPSTPSCSEDALQPFEPLVYDVDQDNILSIEDRTIVGPILTSGVSLTDEPKIRYWDANDNNTWDDGEPIFYDEDSDLATVQDRVFLIGIPTTLTTHIRDDPRIKFVDLNNNNQLNGVVKVTARIGGLGGTWPDGTYEDADALQIVYTYDPTVISVMRVSYETGTLLPDLGTYTSVVRTHCINAGGTPLDSVVPDESASKISSSHLCTIGLPQPEDLGLGCDPALVVGCPGDPTTGGPLENFDALYVQFMVISHGDPNLQHVFDSPGTPGSLIRDLDESEARDLPVTLVENQPPNANFTFEPARPRVGQTVRFDGTSSFDPDGTIVRYIWDFGDGSGPFLPEGQVLSYAYGSPGTFTVTLTVIDDGGASSTTSQQVTVEAMHDVAVDSIQISPADRLVSGQLAVVTVAIRNAGAGEENVTVRTFYDGALIGEVTLRVFGSPYSPQFSYASIFWDTSSVSSGEYLLSAEVRIEFDQDLSNNLLENGFVTILPPPILEVSPRQGPVGTSVTVRGSGFPETTATQRPILVSFDDIFLGYTFTSTNEFSFTFNVPQVEPGPHEIEALDALNFLRATASFEVIARPEHDVAVRDVQIAPSTRLVSGQLAVVIAVIENQGTDDENVTVRAFYDDVLIGTATVELLGFRFYPYTAYVNIFWDTASVPPGEHVIRAEAEIAFDEEPSNNLLTTGPVTILPPPILEMLPARGPAGTKVTLFGYGFPETPSSQGFPRPIFVSFNDQFIGFTLTQGSSFTFTFNVPRAQPGQYAVKVLDVLAVLRTSSQFTVIDRDPLALDLDVGSFYFEGDTAIATLQVQKNGHRIDATGIQATLTLSNGTTRTMDIRKIEDTTGLYKIEIAIPSRRGTGTYTITVEASYNGEFVDSQGHALKEFIVKTVWLSPRGIQTASIAGSLATLGLAVAILIGKGLFNRRKNV